MSNENTMDLQRCPFCGKPAQMKTSPHVPTGTDYTPQCSNSRCIGRLTKKYTDKDKAIKEWNTRASSDDPSDNSTAKDMIEPSSISKSKVNYWKCKNCGSLHRNEGGTHRDKDGKLCCDTCGTPIFEVNAEKLK